MTSEGLDDQDILNLLAEDIASLSCSEEYSDNDYQPSDDDNEYDGILSPEEYCSDDETLNEDLQADSGLYETNASTLKSKNNSEIWSTIPLSQGRCRTHNLVREKASVTSYAKRNIDTIDSAFLLFFQNSILDEICKWTNHEGSQKMKDDWRPIDENELKKFIGTLLLIGVYKSKGESLSQLWSKSDGRPIFNQLFARNRFQTILRMMRFDDAEARRRSRSSDKLQPIRKVFDIWNTSLQNAYIPGTNLTIDEQLVTFRGKCPFRQYIPSKPGRYGIKFWAICDSETSYALKLDIYKGKEPNDKKAKNVGTNVVLLLSESYRNTGRNITCDNFFTSLQLGRQLLQNKLTLVGTIRKNRGELPTAFITTKKRNPFSTIYGFQKDSTIISYCPKKNKVVTLLSTMHYDKGREMTSKNVPEIISYYNSTKGGVDTMDQMTRCYSVKRMTRRWPMIVFFNMIDISALNAIIIWMKLEKSPKKQKNIRRHLLIKLAKSLAKINTEESLPVSFPSSSQGSENFERKRRRCCLCPSKRDRKSKVYCYNCEQNVCSEHSITLCQKCKI